MEKKKGIIIIAVIAILVLSIISIIFLNKEKSNPEDVIKQYMSYITEKNYDEMYQLTTKETAQEEYITRNENIYEGIEVSKLNINIAKTTKKGKEAEVVYSTSMSTIAGEVNFSNTTNLVKENGIYKIKWSSNIIFPTLNNEYKVRVETLSAKRGTIYDKNGKILAADQTASQIGLVPGRMDAISKEADIKNIAKLLDISEDTIKGSLSASYVKEDTFVPIKTVIKSETELKEKLLQIRGIKIVDVEERVYNLGEASSHLLGYVQGISAEELNEKKNEGYNKNSKIGKTGIEKIYEDRLRAIEGEEIYISKQDIGNYFDKYIYEEKQNNQIITTNEDKIAEISLEKNEKSINGTKKETYAHAIKRDDVIYIPIQEMEEIYGIEVEYKADTKVVTIDSITREQKKAIIVKDVAVKSSTRIIAKTIDRVKKGSYVIVISEEKGYSKIRTENGKIGYVKSNKIANTVVVREAIEKEENKEKINLVWDYFSTYAQAPNRTGEKMEGVNVVSPAFFHLDSNGKIQENIGDKGQAYIEWAHNNGYKVWPMVQNAGDGMLTVTSKIMNDYKKRQELIDEIFAVCIKYKLDGINIDFENMKQEDKN